MVVQRQWSWIIVGGKGKGKKGKDKGGSVKTCYYCNKPGHLAKDCWQNPKGKERIVMGVPLIKVKGITKEKEKVQKALRLKEKERARSLARITPWRVTSLSVNIWQKEKNGQITQNQEDWPDNEATYEEPGEQGAICVGEGLSAVSARAKAASRAAQRLQKDFEAGKLWKRPQNFWCMPWKLVCQESHYKGTLVCGYQGCWRNNKAFPYREFLQAASLVEGGHWRPSQQDAVGCLGASWLPSSTWPESLSTLGSSS